MLEAFNFTFEAGLMKQSKESEDSGDKDSNLLHLLRCLVLDPRCYPCHIKTWVLV